MIDASSAIFMGWLNVVRVLEWHERALLEHFMKEAKNRQKSSTDRNFSPEALLSAVFLPLQYTDPGKLARETRRTFVRLYGLWINGRAKFLFWMIKMDGWILEARKKT